MHSYWGTFTMFTDIVNHPDVDKFDLTSLQAALVGGSSCSVELWKHIEEKLGVTNLITLYGTTENSPVSCSTRVGETPEKKYHTVGTPLDHVEVKIVDNDGRIVPVNKEGELCTRDRFSFLGYWGDKEQTGQVFDDACWYHTGDIAVMDEDGYISIVGTFKDMINRGGECIYPQEVEEFLLSYPDVAEAQVVGVPDQRMGEVACAWVKLKGGSTVTETELREYCKKKDVAHGDCPSMTLIRSYLHLILRQQLAVISIVLLNHYNTEGKVTFSNFVYYH
ncbi:medium-chain acyl-CoA ligase ACSF2, mitochondrial-like [Tachypleus tridentatus]|uniref:medium-chain acyl-CoA ligase ACSF2, mitochondrial-like n=1 Tax=Tachypleus tridentatus TaxID=6853 RepID=UPI003FCFE7FF